MTIYLYLCLSFNHSQSGRPSRASLLLKKEEGRQDGRLHQVQEVRRLRASAAEREMELVRHFRGQTDPDDVEFQQENRTQLL